MRNITLEFELRDADKVLFVPLAGQVVSDFVPIALAHDSEYNFGSVATPVNPRVTQTELLASEATHQQAQGYYQMADIMFSVMAKVWGS